MKVGVVTHYYKSANFGGNLQAYALCTVLNNIGYDTEQISLKLHFESLRANTQKVSLFSKFIQTFILYHIGHFMIVKH